MKAEVVLPTFDLSYVVNQLRCKLGWPERRLLAAVEEYRKFLALCRISSKRGIVPSSDVDEIWHRHILNTQQYMLDCREYFGHYLHHRPTPNGNQAAVEATKALYAETFGVQADCSNNCSGPSGCGDNCASHDKGSENESVPAICDAGGCDHAFSPFRDLFC